MNQKANQLEEEWVKRNTKASF